MKIFTEKSSSKDTLTRSRQGINQKQTPVNRSVPAFSGSIPLIQRKALCPCDGGCPRCTGVIQPGGLPVRTDPVTSVLTPKKKGTSILKNSHQFERDLANRILRHKNPGKILEPPIKTEMESLFGQDFGNVRIHQSGREVDVFRFFQADAFTIGSEVFFAPGKYETSSQAGKRLIAHELTHVLQQRNYSNIEERRNIYEAEADRYADSISRNIGIPSGTTFNNESSSTNAIQFHNFVGRYNGNPALYLDYETAEMIRAAMQLGSMAARIIAGFLESLGVDQEAIDISFFVSGLLRLGAMVLGIVNAEGNGVIIVYTGVPGSPVMVYPRSSTVLEV